MVISLQHLNCAGQSDSPGLRHLVCTGGTGTAGCGFSTGKVFFFFHFSVTIKEIHSVTPFDVFAETPASRAS